MGRVGFTLSDYKKYAGVFSPGQTEPLFAPRRGDGNADKTHSETFEASASTQSITGALRKQVGPTAES